MKDPIVEEVRAVRDEIAREHNYDLDEIFAMLRASAEKSGRTHESPDPPKVERPEWAAQQANAADRGSAAR
jgi:hypothetical protein